ncbi:MAG: isopenicillin N synthase family dioxygenase [Acidimicrobiales bacterium]
MPDTTASNPGSDTPGDAEYDLAELRLESTIGGLGVEDENRSIPVISLADFEGRRAEITDELWAAATRVGFFQLSDHGIPQPVIDGAFAAAADFFALPDEVKGQYPWRRNLNAGWESKTQVRPSTRVADQKESYQMTRPHMDLPDVGSLWPTEAELAGFRATVLDMERRCWRVAMDVLSCFAERLGYDREFLTRAHDPEGEGYQSTLRLLHYFPMSGDDFKGGQWRAGAHTDYNCLTLLFQRTGQSGLQVSPGTDAANAVWTSVDPRDDIITCNIGDMLMRWSDDQLRSNFHRVRGPRQGEDAGSRYSVAFFAQANKPALIESPTGRFEPITAGDFLQQRVNANFVA